MNYHTIAKSEIYAAQYQRISGILVEIIPETGITLANTVTTFFIEFSKNGKTTIVKNPDQNYLNSSKLEDANPQFYQDGSKVVPNISNADDAMMCAYNSVLKMFNESYQGVNIETNGTSYIIRTDSIIPKNNISQIREDKEKSKSALRRAKKDLHKWI